MAESESMASIPCGHGAYAANGDRMLVWQFTVVYFVICYGSIACWAYAGSFCVNT